MEEKFLQEEEPGAAKSSRYQTRRHLNKSSVAKPFAEFDIAKITGKNTFKEGEKLKSRKVIDKLFNEGKAVSKNGFTLIYLVTPLTTFYPAQVGFSVPKKFFKHAVDRNRVKRLMREFYRMNKLELYTKLCSVKKQAAVMFVYKGKQLPKGDEASTTLLTCLKQVADKCSK